MIDRHIERLRGLVERECVASILNNTKWMEAMSAVTALCLRCRAKLLTDSEPTRWGYNRISARPFIEGTVGSPVHVLEIEWLEVEPFRRERRGALVPDNMFDETEEFERRLKSAAVPFTWEGRVIRITGHVQRAD